MKAKRKYPNGQDAVEKRAFPCKLEIRGTDQGTTIEGYAAVFDTRSQDLGGFHAGFGQTSGSSLAASWLTTILVWKSRPAEKPRYSWVGRA